MARYTTTIDIWTLDDTARRRLQIGQWVSAGPLEPNGSNRGRFYGQGASTVVAWLGNARGRFGYRNYMSTLHSYGCTITSRDAIRSSLARLQEAL